MTGTDHNDDPLLTIRDCAARWGCHRITAHQRIVRDGVPRIKFGGAVRVRLSDIMRYEAGLTRVGRQPVST